MIHIVTGPSETTYSALRAYSKRELPDAVELELDCSAVVHPKVWLESNIHELPEWVESDRDWVAHTFDTNVSIAARLVVARGLVPPEAFQLHVIRADQPVRLIGMDRWGRWGRETPEGIFWQPLELVEEMMRLFMDDMMEQSTERNK